VLPDNQSTTTKTNHRAEGVEYPNLGIKVMIVGNCFRSGAISMFASAGCSAAATVGEADLICFLGGEDVDPDLYGEKVLRGTYFNRARDDAEMDVFTEAQRLGVPCFGICRGMQFLHVMNGGKLYQDVVNHAGRDHVITDATNGKTVFASSMHHQMCIADESMTVLATAVGHSGIYRTYGSELNSDKVADLEAAIYPDINSIAVQGHPEVAGLPEYTAWCLQKVEDFLLGSETFKVVPSTINPDSLPPAIH
jgi:gamma-glutamyl-gamma-aminobutyrate hydrolase PuuD